MLFATVVQLITGHDQEPTNWFESIVYLLGSSVTAMLLAVLFAIYSMGIKQSKNMTTIMKSFEEAIGPIAMLL